MARGMVSWSALVSPQLSCVVILLACSQCILLSVLTPRSEFIAQSWRVYTHQSQDFIPSGIRRLFPNTNGDSNSANNQENNSHSGRETAFTSVDTEDHTEYRVHSPQESMLKCATDCVIRDEAGGVWVDEEPTLSLEKRRPTYDSGARPKGSMRGLKHATQSYTSISTTSTLSATTPTVVFCAGGITITLPSASGTAVLEATNIARYYTIVNSGTSACTVSTSSSQQIYTNIQTTSWTDNSPYDTLYGGAVSSSTTSPTATTAAFTDTSTYTTMYGHNVAALPVSTAYSNPIPYSTVIGSVSVSPTTVQSSVSDTPTPVVTGIR